MIGQKKGNKTLYKNDKALYSTFDFVLLILALETTQLCYLYNQNSINKLELQLRYLSYVNNCFSLNNKIVTFVIADSRNSN